MKQNVLIIGAGFAGIQLAHHLNEDLFEVMLLDKINHHQFQPLFYQVATSQLEPSSISFPLRYILRGKKNIQIRMAEVEGMDNISKCVHTNIGTFTYDILIIASGCRTNFFGNAEIETNAFTLKSSYDAIEIRNHILQIFEEVISAPESEKEALMRIVIVGAGPTGVELAGAFAEIKQHILPSDYPRIDFSKLRICLIEGSKHSLNNMSFRSKLASENYLRQMGVEIYTETFVTHYDGIHLELSKGEPLKTRSLIWAAGVIANKIIGLPDAATAPANRIRVDRFNAVMGLTDVYAVGDVSYMETERYPKGHPQVANVAINQAKNLARNLNRVHKKKSPLPYEYTDLGSMATIGRNKAVVDIGKLHLNGHLAWLIWMFLHLMLILSVKNKLIIFINWAWAYISKNSSLRLILTPAHTQSSRKKSS